MERSFIGFVLVALLCGPFAAGCSEGDSDGDVDAPVDGFDGEDVPDETPGEDAAEVPDEAVEVEADGDVGEVSFCASQPDGTACDDGDPCTLGDACGAGLCVPGGPRDCNDVDPCTDDTCDSVTGECVHDPNTVACEDGDPCTLGDACSGGSCAPGAPMDCSSLTDTCNTGTCNSLTGACDAAPLADGTACDDGDLCTSGETCAGGACIGGVPPDCSGLDDACNTGRCSGATGTCVAEPVPDGTVCDDGVGCTSGDRCRLGACAGDRPDEDGDGYYVLGCLDGDDCDDGLWDVHPGAGEGPVGRASCFDRLDNDCDTFTDAADVPCGDGLDLVLLDSPATLTVNVGATTPLIRGHAYEPGATEAAGPMTDLTANVGWGPLRTDPTDNPAWTWGPSDYWGQGGPGNVRDVFAGAFTAPPAGIYSYAYRFTLDAGATWLYADLDGNGAAPPSNGIQVDRLGRLTVIVNDHLLINEVVVVPTASEYVEIHNPTGAAVDLSRVFLTDAGDVPAGLSWRYWDLVTGAAGPIRTWDFVVRFPDGASIPAGGLAVVALGSNAAFRSAHGRDADYEACPGSPDDPAVPNMLPAWAGSVACSPAGALNNSEETLVLFRWDGASDLVQDLDVVTWGGTAEAMCKTGVSRDGPDAGTTASAYLPDTAVASQHFLPGTPHAVGGSYERTDPGEVGETRTGGNGITGNDEMSEDFSSTWAVSATATPGT